MVLWVGAHGRFIFRLLRGLDFLSVLLQRRTVLSSLVNMISDLRNSLHLVVTLVVTIIVDCKRYPYI